MADLTITPANVVGAGTLDTEQRKAGATITAGQSVYLDAATDKYLLADSNSGTAAAKRARGIALHGAANNQPLTIAKRGDLTIGATLTPGATYFLSDTPGGICPDADVGTGEDVCLIGIAKSASVLSLDIRAAGVAR